MVQMVVAVAAVACAGVAAGGAVLLWLKRKARIQRRTVALSPLGVKEHDQTNQQQQWVLRYIQGLTRRLFIGATQPLNPSVRHAKAEQTRSGMLYTRCATQAGCAHYITPSAFCEARTRLALVGAGIGLIAGALLSVQLGALLGMAGALLGYLLPAHALRRCIRQRALLANLHLSEMLEVVALGLRSGMTFDHSFGLYGTHFSNPFAQSCQKAYRLWTLGLASREEALRNLAASYDCDQLQRVIDSIIRSLKLGTALAGILEEAGSQSRAAYRATLEERVAKAPVKMMLPTGTLILPAMLLMVMGPVLLELANGF